MIKKTRRNIARINTVLNEKQKQLSEETKTDEQA
jgi:ribosomal protein L29